jgi:hypothetical protein
MLNDQCSMLNAKCQMQNAKWATTGIYRFTYEKPGAEKKHGTNDEKLDYRRLVIRHSAFSIQH